MAAATGRSTTVGVTGQLWRASVAPWGAVTPWVSGAQDDASAGSSTLDWFVAADDRWHVPADEAAVRQRRIDGAPVTETRVRIPDGDAVQRVWSVADSGGLTIIEVENDSPLPFVVAFAGLDVLTERPPADVPIQGIDLPSGAISLPVGHHASIRVAIPHDERRASGRLTAVPDAAAVVRGWVSIAEQASRFGLPDDGLAEAVIAARCDLLLEGPVDADVDPLGFVLDVGELVRTGDDAAPWLIELVAPLEAVARCDDPLLPTALSAARRVAVAAGDRRAAGDIERLQRRTAARVAPAPLGPFSDLRRTGAVGRFVAEVERRLASGGDLLPTGLPARWLGTNFEVHGVPTSFESAVSFAVRWHGERPAVLWEQTGATQRLSASAIDPQWTSSEPMGESLWAPPPPAARTPITVSTMGGDPSPESTSFS